MLLTTVTVVTVARQPAEMLLRYTESIGRTRNCEISVGVQFF